LDRVETLRVAEVEFARQVQAETQQREFDERKERRERNAIYAYSCGRGQRTGARQENQGLGHTQLRLMRRAMSRV
jgi:hypothetical protein